MRSREIESQKAVSLNLIMVLTKFLYKAARNRIVEAEVLPRRCFSDVYSARYLFFRERSCSPSENIFFLDNVYVKFRAQE